MADRGSVTIINHNEKISIRGRHSGNYLPFAVQKALLKIADSTSASDFSILLYSDLIKNFNVEELCDNFYIGICLNWCDDHEPIIINFDIGKISIDNKIFSFEEYATLNISVDDGLDFVERTNGFNMLES